MWVGLLIAMTRDHDSRGRVPEKPNRDTLLVGVGIVTLAVPTVLLSLSVTYLFALPLVGGSVVAWMGRSLHQWHVESAAFADGTPIPNADEAGNDPIAYRSGGVRTVNGGREEYWSVIGTAAEFGRLHDVMDFSAYWDALENGSPSNGR